MDRLNNNKQYLFLAKGGSLGWSLHFWLGLESSQDERGAAAILTAQMDDYLGGGPVQYREIQEHESAPFMALFRNGVKYMVYLTCYIIGYFRALPGCVL